VYWSIEVPEQNSERVPLPEQARSTIEEFFHFFDRTRWSRTLHRIQ
jgi:hypothetical protein